MRKKIGWTVYGILGFIFAPMGFLFLMIGLPIQPSQLVILECVNTFSVKRYPSEGCWDSLRLHL